MKRESLNTLARGTLYTSTAVNGLALLPMAVSFLARDTSKERAYKDALEEEYYRDNSYDQYADYGELKRYEEALLEKDFDGTNLKEAFEAMAEQAAADMMDEELMAVLGPAYAISAAVFVLSLVAVGLTNNTTYVQRRR